MLRPSSLCPFIIDTARSESRSLPNLPATKLVYIVGMNLYKYFWGNSFISPTRSGTTEIYIFGPADAGNHNKICNIHLIDIVLQVQKYLEVKVFLVLQKYLENQK